MSDKMREEIQYALYAWMREDAPLAAKMVVEPKHIDALARRLDALLSSVTLPEERNEAKDADLLVNKIGQMYQIIGTIWYHYSILGNMNNIVDSDWIALLNYLADEEKYDDDFLPWPHSFTSGDAKGGNK